MNKLFLVAIVLGIINFHDIKQCNDKILWGEKNLTWDDFKGSPPENYNTTIGAFTKTTIVCKETDLESPIPKINVKAYFIKSESYILVNDDESLLHEKLHFDITEIFARKMRKSIDSLNALKRSDFIVYEKIIKKIESYYDNYNIKYDSEVNFNKVKLEIWRTRISNELERLNKFENISDD